MSGLNLFSSGMAAMSSEAKDLLLYMAPNQLMAELDVRQLQITCYCSKPGTALANMFLEKHSVYQNMQSSKFWCLHEEDLKDPSDRLA